MPEEPGAEELFDKVHSSRRQFVKYLVALPFAAPALLVAGDLASAQEATTMGAPQPTPRSHHHHQPPLPTDAPTPVVITTTFS
jgi:hypothetical protein